MEPQLTAGLSARQIPEFIQNNEVMPHEIRCKAARPSYTDFALIRLVHQVDDIEEPASTAKPRLRQATQRHGMSP